MFLEGIFFNFDGNKKLIFMVVVNDLMIMFDVIGMIVGEVIEILIDFGLDVDNFVFY